jgi:ubiquinone/menaquinone biosynthesis C-methylase UbiE
MWERDGVDRIVDRAWRGFGPLEGSGVELQYVSCNLCGSWNAEILYPSTVQNLEDPPDFSTLRCTTASYCRHFTIVRCKSCGLVYANPRRPLDVLLQEYESVEDPLYVAEREGRVLTFSRNLKPLEKITGPAGGRRLLDVGCHIGVFLEVASEHGWESWGVEPSCWAVRLAQERGLRVKLGTLAKVAFPSAFFDVVTLWDVIEHLSDPKAELEEIYRILKPGGLVCIHTINIESLLARLLGRRWPWFLEMHIYYFSPRTLGRVLEEIGFQVHSYMNQGRFIRLSYLATRIEAFFPRVGRLLGILVDRLSLNSVPIPINLGDLFTIFAIKP